MRTILSLVRRAGLERPESKTSEPGSGPPALPRRQILRGGALMFGAGAALGAAGLASPAWAGKIPQAQAGYSARPRGGEECDKCLQFQPPSACKIVDGVVSPSGSCNFFGPKPH